MFETFKYEKNYRLHYHWAAFTDNQQYMTNRAAYDIKLGNMEGRRIYSLLFVRFSASVPATNNPEQQNKQ